MYDYFKTWREDGTDKQIHDLLRGRVRGRSWRGSQCVMCLDSQTVDSSFSAIGETVGFDGNKRRKGRKRHLAVDTMGLLLEVSVTAADVPDLWEGERLIDAVRTRSTRAWSRRGWTTATAA